MGATYSGILAACLVAGFAIALAVPILLDVWEGWRSGRKKHRHQY